MIVFSLVISFYFFFFRVSFRVGFLIMLEIIEYSEVFFGDVGIKVNDEFGFL